ncbi:MAG: class II aldolase/adducin family protein [Eubacteriales bacterium]|nr:class II aldolase/adducin family protein [Eubacteriales bacterium]
MDANELNVQQELKLKEQICEIGRLLFARGMVASNDGNISCRTPDGNLLVTPTGVSKGAMTPDMILKVDLEGNVLEGTWKKTSELPMHLRAYDVRPDVQAVVHAHPPTATGFACAGEPLDDYVATEAVYALGCVPIAPYATPSTPEVPDSITPLLAEYDAMMLEFHGVLTVGADLMAAYYLMESVEQYAKISLTVHQIAPGRMMPREKIEEFLEIRRQADVPGRHPGFRKLPRYPAGYWYFNQQ